MSGRTSGWVVAVVDDDPGILRSLVSLLESADYAVRPFTSAAALLQSAALHDIDVLISDLDMPGMDGFELLQEVHAARPGLPIIFITGDPDTAKRWAGASGPRPRFFAKPFQGSELLAALGKSLGRFPAGDG